MEMEILRNRSLRNGGHGRAWQVVRVAWHGVQGVWYKASLVGRSPAGMALIYR